MGAAISNSAVQILLPSQSPDASRAKHQFRRIRPRLPARLVSESLDFLPPAEERLQLAGAVDEAEYIHPVFQRPVEKDHPFNPCDAERAYRAKRRGPGPRMPAHVPLRTV